MGEGILGGAKLSTTSKSSMVVKILRKSQWLMAKSKNSKRLQNS